MDSFLEQSGPPAARPAIFYCTAGPGFSKNFSIICAYRMLCSFIHVEAVFGMFVLSDVLAVGTVAFSARL